MSAVPVVYVVLASRGPYPVDRDEFIGGVFDARDAADALAMRLNEDGETWAEVIRVALNVGGYYTGDDG